MYEPLAGTTSTESPRVISRIRFRYSLRSAVSILTLACVIAGTRHNCRHRATEDVEAATGWPPSVVAPSLLRTITRDNVTVRRTFHVWCFGAVIDLPFRSEYPEPNPFIITVQPRIIIDSEPPLEGLGSFEK